MKIGPSVNPFVGKRHLHEIARRTHSAFKRKPGFTIDPSSGQFLTTASHPSYIYALEKHGCITNSPPSYAAVLRWLKAKWFMFSMHGAYIGGWVDEGLSYLDVSILELNKNRAIIYGLQNRQISIYDLQNREVIYLASWGEAV